MLHCATIWCYNAEAIHLDVTVPQRECARYTTRKLHKSRTNRNNHCCGVYCLNWWKRKVHKPSVLACDTFFSGISGTGFKALHRHVLGSRGVIFLQVLTVHSVLHFLPSLPLLCLCKNIKLGHHVLCACLLRQCWCVFQGGKKKKGKGWCSDSRNFY